MTHFTWRKELKKSEGGGVGVEMSGYNSVELSLSYSSYWDQFLHCQRLVIYPIPKTDQVLFLEDFEGGKNNNKQTGMEGLKSGIFTHLPYAAVWSPCSSHPVSHLLAPLLQREAHASLLMRVQLLPLFVSGGKKETNAGLKRLVSLFVSWAQSTTTDYSSNQSWIQTLIHLSLTLHTSHLTPTTIFLQHSYNSLQPHTYTHTYYMVEEVVNDLQILVCNIVHNAALFAVLSISVCTYLKCQSGLSYQ